MAQTVRLARTSSELNLGVLRSHTWLIAVLALGLLLRALDAIDITDASDAGRTAGRLLLHLTGVLTALLVYAVAVRWGVWRWLGALAALPGLLDTRLVENAPEGGPSALLTLLLSVGVAVLCWYARPRPTLVVLGVAAIVVAVTGMALAAHRTLPAPSDLHRLWLLAAVLLALGATAGLARSRVVPLRLACLVVAVVPVLALVAHGWLLPTLAWWPAAGALGVTALLRGDRARAAAREQVDDVDRAAEAAFDARYDSPRLAHVVVVIAAYEEASGLPGVLAGLPRTAGGLPVEVLVVDDGSRDDTADAAEASGRALVVRCATNRGQGAALRLGYRIARGHGARFLVTTDADGQYDAGDIPAVLAPLLEDRADFVSGSRRLGHQHTQDRVRRLGVHVFARIVSALVGHRVTDTSFGLRAMRAEVTATVTLNQPQYQSSELMIGAFSHGFRVAEVPGTMHRRGAGTTKKGRNLVYGRRYAGVVLGTWWREGCPTPVTRAPALQSTRPATDA